MAASILPIACLVLRASPSSPKQRYSHFQYWDLFSLKAPRAPQSFSWAAITLNANSTNQRDSGESPPSVRLRDAYRFFTPLMLMAELTMFSHAIVAGFLARFPDPTPVLAAYSIAFFFHSMMGSPVWACQMVSLSFMRCRRTARRMFFFCWQVIAAIGWVWLVLGLTSVGDWFFGSVMGLGPEIVESAKLCILVMILMLPLVAIRMLMYAILMRARRTILVTYGTVVRVLSLFPALYICDTLMDGAVVGATAIIVCIALEMLYALVAAWPFYRRLPATSDVRAEYKEVWIFAWPVMIMHTAEHGVSFLVSLFLGRLPNPETALAVFGVVDSALKVLLSPLRNLTVTVQSLAHEHTDYAVLAKFCLQIGVAFATVLALFFVPAINDWTLMAAMGLSAQLADYAGYALGIGVALALSTAAAAAARGFLISSAETRILALSSAMRLIAVALVGTTAVQLGAGNGAAVGLWALTAAFATEAAVLLYRVRNMRKAGTLRPS